MKWEKVKNFVIGGGLVLVWGITLGFLEWRSSVNSSEYLSSEAGKLAINHMVNDYLSSEPGQLVINAMIDDKLSAQDLATDSNIVSMNTDIAANAAVSAGNKEDISLTQQQLIDIANILMRPPGDL